MVSSSSSTSWRKSTSRSPRSSGSWLKSTIRELIDALREEHGGEALASQLEELANRVELVQRKLGMMEARLASLEKAVEEGASRELKELLVKLASLMEELREAVAELRAVALIAE